MMEMKNTKIKLGIFGFITSIPAVILFSCIKIWFFEYGISKNIIGMIGICSIPYAFKFLFHNVITSLHIPIFEKKFSKYASWAIVSQIMLTIAAIIFTYCTPTKDLILVFLAMMILVFGMSIQDVCIYGYQITKINNEKTDQNKNLNTLMSGYRIGFIIISALTLSIAEIYDWHISFATIAGIFMCNTIFIIFDREMKCYINNHYKNHNQDHQKLRFGIQKSLKSILMPMKIIYNQSHGYNIILFIILYKSGDFLVHGMKNIFFIEQGYSKIEIASVVKTFGACATFLGTWITYKISMHNNMYQSLIMASFWHCASILMFLVQYYSGYNMTLLYIAIAIENVTSGIMTGVLFIYMAKIGSNHANIIFPFLWGVSQLTRGFCLVLSGFISDALGWPSFFIIAILMFIPGMIMARKRFLNKNEFSEIKRA